MFRLTLLMCIFGLTYSQVSAGLVTEAIIGGDYAKKEDFKYQVSVQVHGQNICGGAIIADLYILTGAHCIMDHRGRLEYLPYSVVAGTDNLKDKHEIIVEVETVYFHKHFDIKTYHNDIAILKLKHPLNLSANSKKIEKINLPKADSNYDHLTAVASGFGVERLNLEKDNHGHWQEHGGESDGKLKHAQVKIIPNKECAKTNKRQIIYETVICGQVHQRHKHHYEGVCDGDSGGPLVHGHEIIGIISASPFACNETTEAATYTRVSSYLNLIHNVLDNKHDDNVESEKM